MAVGQTMALARKKTTTKVIGSEKLLPALQIMLDGYTKADPPTQKKLPVKADVAGLLIEMAMVNWAQSMHRPLGACPV